MFPMGNFNFQMPRQGMQMQPPGPPPGGPPGPPPGGPPQQPGMNLNFAGMGGPYAGIIQQALMRMRQNGQGGPPNMQPPGPPPGGPPGPPQSRVPQFRPPQRVF